MASVVITTLSKPCQITDCTARAVDGSYCKRHKDMISNPDARIWFCDTCQKIKLVNIPKLAKYKGERKIIKCKNCKKSKE